MVLIETVQGSLTKFVEITFGGEDCTFLQQARASGCCTSFWTMCSEMQRNLLVLVIYIIRQVHLWGLHSSLDLYEAWKQNVGTGSSPRGIPKTSKWTVQVDDWSPTYLHHYIVSWNWINWLQFHYFWSRLQTLWVYFRTWDFKRHSIDPKQMSY